MERRSRPFNADCSMGVCIVLWLTIIHSITGSSVHYYGNDLLMREDYLETGGEKTFVDHDLELGEGYVTKFAFYIHQSIPDGYLDGSTIKMQVWRPEGDDSTPKYKLLVEKQITIFPTHINNNRTEVVLEAEDQLSSYIRASDKLGFTGVSATVPISFQFTPGRHVFFRASTDGHPLLGQSYQFERLSFPALFSMGIYLTPDPPKVMGELLMYGNEVKSYGGTMAGQRAWIDDVIRIEKNGTLRMFAFYAEPYEGEPTLRLQIWTVTKNMGEFNLKWEMPVVLSSGEEQIYRVSIPETQAPYVTSADRLGWTFEGNTGPISSTFDHNHGTYFMPIDNQDHFPEVGKHSQFIEITMPRKFAVQIGIKEGAGLSEDPQPTGMVSAIPNPSDPPTSSALHLHHHHDILGIISLMLSIFYIGLPEC